MTSITCSKSWCPSEENGLFSARSAPHPPEFQRHYDKRENNFHLKGSTIRLFVWRIKCFPLLQSQRCQSGAFPEKFKLSFFVIAEGTSSAPKVGRKTYPRPPSQRSRKVTTKGYLKQMKSFVIIKPGIFSRSSFVQSSMNQGLDTSYWNREKPRKLNWHIWKDLNILMERTFLGNLPTLGPHCK